jgi:hypothetical protein
MPYVLMAVAIAAALGGWFGRGHWDEGEIANLKLEYEQKNNAALAEAAATKAMAEKIAANVDTRLSNLRITNRTINNEVRHETEKVVYGNPDCDLPASGVVLINQSIREANRASGYVSSEVPPGATPPTKGGKSNDGGPVQPR